jgi:hypothetical protein
MVLDGGYLCFSVVAVFVWVIGVGTVHCLSSVTEERQKKRERERAKEEGDDGEE